MASSHESSQAVTRSTNQILVKVQLKFSPDLGLQFSKCKKNVTTVSSVKTDSVFHGKIKKGYVILSLNGKEVAGVESFHKIFEDQLAKHITEYTIKADTKNTKIDFCIPGPLVRQTNAKKIRLPNEFIRNIQSDNEAPASEDNSYLQTVVDEVINDMVVSDLQALAQCRTETEYRDLTSKLKSSIQVQNPAKLTSQIRTQEIKRFIFWINSNRDALMDLCKGWSGFLEDIHALKLNLYMFARAGKDLNEIFGSIGLSKALVMKSKVTSNLREEFFSKVCTWKQLHSLNGMELNSDFLDEMLSTHNGLLQLLASLIAICDNEKCLSNARNNIASEIPDLCKSGKKLIKDEVCPLYSKKIGIDCESLFLKRMTIQLNRETRDMMIFSSESNNALDKIHAELNNLKLNVLIAQNAEEIENEFTDKHEKMRDWIIRFVQNLQQCTNETLTTYSDMKLHELIAQLNDLISAKILKGHFHGFTWKKPQALGRRSITKNVKYMFQIHSALVMMARMNSSFFTNDLEAESQTLDIARKHTKKMEDKGFRNQRTALSAGQKESFLKHQYQKFKRLHKTMESALAAFKKAEEENQVPPKVTESYTRALNELYVESGRLCLAHLGFSTSGRIKQLMLSKLSKRSNSNGRDTINMKNKKSDFKTRPGELELSLSHHKDCPTDKSLCICCLIEHHLDMQLQVNDFRRKRNQPLVDLYPAYKSKSMMDFGGLNNCRMTYFPGRCLITREDRSKSRKATDPSKKKRKKSSGASSSDINMMSKYWFDENCKISASSLIKNLLGYARVKDLPEAGPLKDLQERDIIAKICDTESNLSAEDFESLESNVDKYENIKEIMENGRSNRKTVYIYYLREEQILPNFGSTSFAKWLQSAVSSWQEELNFNEGDALYLSEKQRKNIASHTLRVTGSVIAYDSGCDIVSIQKALDHKSTQMTIRYISQSKRSRGCKSQLVDLTTTGETMDEFLIKKANSLSLLRKTSKQVPNRIWKSIHSDTKKYEDNGGILKYQCRFCVSIYDERRFKAFASNQKLKQHQQKRQCRSTPEKEKTAAKESAKNFRLILESSGFSLQKCLGSIKDANANMKRQQINLQKLAENGKVNSKKRKRHDVAPVLRTGS